MDPALPQAVLDAADVLAISQLILTERESRDTKRWERMRACFWPDSQVKISWFSGSGPAFVDASIDMAQRKVLARHRLGPVLVRLKGDRAVASVGAIIDIPAMVGGVDAHLSSHARFYYRAERRGGRWGLMSFDSVYLRDEFTTPIPGQALGLTAEDLAPFRASYRMLSYLLTSQGYAVNHELAGEDRPETVQPLVEALYGWAGLEP